MQEEIRTFVEVAMQIGLGPKLAALISEVEASIQYCAPDADERYLRRLEGQLERLRNPDLRLVAAVTTALCTEQPEHWEIVHPVATRLAARHPHLRHLLGSIETARGL